MNCIVWIIIVPVEKLITTEQEMYERAFQLLSIHRVEDAVSVLEDGNAFRLALLLSQIGSDTNNTYLLRSQMELWKSMGAFAQFPAEVSRIYQLLASNVDEPSLILKGLGWKRGLAMLFWYFTENPAIGTFSEALHLYDEALLGNAVDAPMSTYATEALKSRGANVAYPKVKHGIYSLLEVLLSDKSTELNNVLHPAAFTRDELDYQTVYFTSVLLESVGHLSAEQSELAIIRQHIIFQLLSMKKWKWAVFVALQNPNATTRTLQVRDILGRFAAKDGNWESSADHVDIVKLFKVDPKLLFEAHAYKVGSHFNFSKQVQYLHDAELWHEALKVVILKVAPALLSQKPDEYYMTLLQLMEFNEANSSRERVVSVWTEIGSAVLTYLRLYDATKDIQNNPEVQIADVLEEFSNTAKDLLLRIAKIHASKVDVQSNDTLFQQLLQSIASYAYKLLTFIDLKTRNHYPSQTVLFHDYVLQHAPVQMQFFEEAANTSNLAMMKFSADCLSF